MKKKILTLIISGLSLFCQAQNAELAKMQNNLSELKAPSATAPTSKKTDEPKLFKTAVQHKKLAFTLDQKKITIVAHDGKELVIEAIGMKPANKRAQGLTPLYNSYADNTGVGFNISEEAGIVELRHANSQSWIIYTIKVPRENSLEIKTGWNQNLLVIEGCSGEITIDHKNGKIKLNNITGPVVAHTISGDIEAEFQKLSSKGPSSFQSVSGFIDITLPKKAKANLSLSTTSGQIYVANPKIVTKDKEKDSKNQFFTGTQQKANASMNGGGVSFSLESISGDIYLREK